MCGINGFTGNNLRRLTAMNDALAHRGPDAQGTYTDAQLSFGQRRLAIIDLSPGGRQPMFYTHGNRTIGIVFNGELYNYQDIRSELRALGYHFSTQSDTEVILASYLAWGPSCVQRFNGMWALCLYDKDKKVLWCSRDRFGKKPFYYTTHAGQFAFSSELKGLLAGKFLNPTLDTEAVGLYFGLGFIPAPWSIYREVRKLEAGHHLFYDLQSKRITGIVQYYELPDYQPERNKAALIRTGRALLKDATRLRMISDVPVGAFLSGGLDSSTVVAQMAPYTNMQKLHTFSLGFAGTTDETAFMQTVHKAFGTQHHHTTYTQEQLRADLSSYADIFDEPFADVASLPLAHLSAQAQKLVTVVLTGDGGDEIFGGYTRHVLARRMEIMRKMPKALRAIGSKIPARKNLNKYASLYLLREGFRLSLRDKSEFLSETLPDDIVLTDRTREWMKQKLSLCLKKSDGDLAEALRIFDLLYYTLPDNFLVKVDRATMAHSLEARAPFLDYRLAEYSMRIPRDWKVDARKTKKLLREIINGIVPETIVKRAKQSFTSTEVDYWYHGQECQQAMVRALQVLHGIDPKLHNFYSTTVFHGNHRLYAVHRMRLIFFGLWLEKWYS